MISSQCLELCGLGIVTTALTSHEHSLSPFSKFKKRNEDSARRLRLRSASLTEAQRSNPNHPGCTSSPSVLRWQRADRPGDVWRCCEALRSQRAADSWALPHAGAQTAGQKPPLVCLSKIKRRQNLVWCLINTTCARAICEHQALEWLLMRLRDTNGISYYRQTKKKNTLLQLQAHDRQRI